MGDLLLRELLLRAIEGVVVLLVLWGAFMSLGRCRCWLKRSAGCISMCWVLYMLLPPRAMFIPGRCEGTGGEKFGWLGRCCAWGWAWACDCCWCLCWFERAWELKLADDSIWEDVLSWFGIRRRFASSMFPLGPCRLCKVLSGSFWDGAPGLRFFAFLAAPVLVAKGGLCGVWMPSPAQLLAP